jgi:hypothetical protein
METGMWWRKNAGLALAVVGGVLMALFAMHASSQTGAQAASENRPARMEAISGSPLKRITLTPKAAERLDIQLAKVRQDGAGKRIVPYGAVIYDKDGSTWVYTSPQPLVFVRHSIVVELINGDDVVLKEGPEVGMPVATTGAPQLYGAEKGVGH